MIKAKLAGDHELITKLEAMPGGIREALKASMQTVALKVLTRVKQDKLSGQVLNVRTGRLRRSINQRVEVEGDRVNGYVGTPLEYAAIHEYGFTGTQNIREYMRTSKSGKSSSVRAHSRLVSMPARSFLRSSVADMKDEISGTIRDAIQGASK